MALAYAAEYLRNVDKLVLLCPGGLADERTEFLREAERNKALGDEGKQKTLQAVLGGETQNIELNKGLMFTLLIGQNFNPRMEKLPVFSGEAISRLAMPVLLVFGENDFVIDADASIRHMTKYAQNVRVDVLPGVGHAVVGHAARIMEFLAGG